MKKICPHFHLSLQSGCDETLKRMNRKYNTKEYYDKCELLRKYFDRPAITTDVIVGFPQESQEEFEITEQFLKKTCFYEMHIFKYSRRKGTVADKMPGQIDEKIKNERSKILLSLEKEMSNDYRKSFIGQTSDVLIEEIIETDGQKYFVGHTPNYLKVYIPFNHKFKVNSSVNVVLKDLFKHDTLLADFS